MAEVRSAAVYARISSDVEGTGLGVERQLTDCHRLAAELGWPVAEDYVDNDLSAYSGKRRPGYLRMIADIEAGSRDAVIVYHLDRLTRRPSELESFVEVLDAARVRQMRFVVGGMDLASGDGLMVARIMAAMAANESATKSRRLRRKHEQLAAAGLPNGGAVRPFGYNADKVTIREPEAVVLREIAARYLAGESLRSIAVWLNDEQVPTVTGGAWTTTTLRGVVRNPRYAGLRTHHGGVVGTAVWPAVFTEEVHHRILARFAERSVSGRRAPRRYLLTGLLRCGKCDATLYSRPRGNVRRYVCMAGPDHGGCGRLSVVADPLERFIADAVLYRLDTPVLADALTGRDGHSEQASGLARELSEDQEKLQDLARSYALSEFTKAEWMTARRIIEDRITRNERQLAKLTRTDALDGLPAGDALRTQWATLNLDRQHAIVAAVLDHASILAGTQGARSLDIDRVVPRWRSS